MKIKPFAHKLDWIRQNHMCLCRIFLVGSQIHSQNQLFLNSRFNLEKKL